VLRGCVPKKLLVYGSHFADYFEDARGFGWAFPGGPPQVDWAALIEKKNKELDRLTNAYKNTLKNANVELIEGKGKVSACSTWRAEKLLTGVWAGRRAETAE
jgi:glutathione reductase (NADPH)